MTELATNRLILRPMRDADRAPFAAMGQDTAVMRFFPQLMSHGEAMAFVDAQIADLAAHGFGAFAVTIRDSHQFAGICGCKLLKWPHHFPTNVEIGWRFASSFWGHGYATEAARAALDHYFALTGDREVVSFTVQANRGSWKVMERLGMTRRRDLDFEHPRVAVGHPLRPHIVYMARSPATN